MPKKNVTQESGIGGVKPPLRADGNRHWYDTENMPLDPKTGKPIHYIEESVDVSLRLDDKGENWIVDGAAFGGEGLYTVLQTGARNEQCLCGTEEECEKVRAYADTLPMPDGEELMLMLARALGYNKLESPEGMYLDGPDGWKKLPR